MDHGLKQLVDKLSAAIGESISESEQIAELARKFKDGGYEVAVILNAAIAVKQCGTGSHDRVSHTNDTNSCNFNNDDIRFLKELHIKVSG